MQGILHFDVQGRSQFIGEVSARGTIDECSRGGQQCAATGEPDLSLRPQSVIVKTGDLAQGIVSTAMGVAGEIIQRFEFTEDGDVDRGTESLFQFVQSGDLVAQQKRAQFIGAEGEGSHNVIVPTALCPPDRNYNKLVRPWLLPVKGRQGPNFRHAEPRKPFGESAPVKVDYDRETITCESLFLRRP